MYQNTKLYCLPRNAGSQSRQETLFGWDHMCPSGMGPWGRSHRGTSCIRIPVSTPCCLRDEQEAQGPWLFYQLAKYQVGEPTRGGHLHAAPSMILSSQVSSPHCRIQTPTPCHGTPARKRAGWMCLGLCRSQRWDRADVQTSDHAVGNHDYLLKPAALLLDMCYEFSSVARRVLLAMLGSP